MIDNLTGKKRERERERERVIDRESEEGFRKR